jgi:hypothetical protein
MSPEDIAILFFLGVLVLTLILAVAIRKCCRREEYYNYLERPVFSRSPVPEDDDPQPPKAA